MRVSGGPPLLTGSALAVPAGALVVLAGALLVLLLVFVVALVLLAALPVLLVFIAALVVLLVAALLVLLVFIAALLLLLVLLLVALLLLLLVAALPSIALLLELLALPMVSLLLSLTLPPLLLLLVLLTLPISSLLVVFLPPASRTAAGWLAPCRTNLQPPKPILTLTNPLPASRHADTTLRQLAGGQEQGLPAVQGAHAEVGSSAPAPEGDAKTAPHALLPEAAVVPLPLLVWRQPKAAARVKDGANARLAAISASTTRRWRGRRPSSSLILMACGGACARAALHTAPHVSVPH
jgi:hypothetical protein